jgi:NAD(P)-dependent dehydrogenase (short-subunit alcohol dehydrogenase family)
VRAPGDASTRIGQPVRHPAECASVPPDPNILERSDHRDLIDTDLIRQFSPEAINAMISRTPLNRLATVEEVARLVAWLCSEDCSFSTGAVFDLSGGRATY